MSSNISFQEDESILFKHKSSHNNEQGELIITSIRVCFVSTNNQLSPVQLPWQSIDKTKYTPMNDPKGRVMLMIQTVVKSGPIVFQLVGDLQSCQRELERLKEIISKLRTSSSTSSSSTSTNQTISASSQTQSTVPKITSKQSLSQSILTTRRNLLEADKQLAAKYRDLVINDKILTENDFWLAVEEKSGITDEKGSATYHDPTIRGKSTSLLDDFRGVSKNGKISYNISPEQKENIFLQHPAVKFAFTEEVPLHKTEIEFWISYMQSEHYNRDKGGGMNKEGTNMLVNRSRIDELLSQYETSLLATANSTSSNCNHEKKRKLEGQVDPSIDLTSTFGDYRPSEAQSLLLPYEDKDSSSSSSSSSFVRDSDNYQHRLAVIGKYNKHSANLMDQQQQKQQQQQQQEPITKSKQHKTTTTTTTTAHTADDTNDFQELQLHEPASSHYIPLHLSSSSSSSSLVSKNNSSIQPLTLDRQAENKSHQQHDDGDNQHQQVVEVEESAFGKSSFRKLTPTSSSSSSSSSIVESHINHLPHTIDMTTKSSFRDNHQELKRIRNTISTAWPTSDRAKQTNQNIILSSLREASLLQPQSVPTRDITDAVSNTATTSTSSTISVSVLQDQDLSQFKKNQSSFLQEMLEKYGTITELLRHFYAILSSPDLSLTSSVTNALQRVEKLIQRLLYHKEQLLRKIDYVDMNIKDRHEKLFGKAIIVDMIKLLDRAEGKWKDYRQAFHI